MEVTCGYSSLPVDAGNVEDGGREVDVEDGLGAPRAGREAGAAHEERHLDVELDEGENSDVIYGRPLVHVMEAP